MRQEFDSEVDDDQYEIKIAGLIRKAYRHDKECGEDAVWDGALADQEEEDNSPPGDDRESRDWRIIAVFSLDRRGGLIVVALPTVFFVAAGIVIALSRTEQSSSAMISCGCALFLILLGAPFLKNLCSDSATAT